MELQIRNMPAGAHRAVNDITTPFFLWYICHGASFTCWFWDEYI